MPLNLIGHLDKDKEGVKGSVMAVGGVPVEVPGVVVLLRRGSSNPVELDEVSGLVEVGKSPAVTALNISKLDLLPVEVPAVPKRPKMGCLFTSCCW